MLLLISGVSGVGKSTARLRLRERLGDRFESHELCTLGPVPDVPTVAWRQQQAEVAVRRTLELEAEGRHVLLAGDPVPAGEVLAAPSADRIDVAVCLLDVDEPSLHARLDGRADPPEWRHRHLAFADWLRRHATDPTHLPDVVTTDAWPEMVWDRWVGRSDLVDVWSMTVLDTSHRDPGDVADRLADWCQAALDGGVPVFRRGWHLA